GALLDRQDARRVVGTFDEGTEQDEKVRLVATDRGRGDAIEQMAAFLHPFEEWRVDRLAARATLALQLQPGVVDGLPHLGRDRAAHRTRARPARLEAVRDARRVVWVPGQEASDAFGRGWLARGLERIEGIGDDQRLEC